jgi:hypothetical protein
LSVAARRYMTGLVAVAVLGAVVVVLAGPSFRTEIAVGVLGGLLLQAPLGWWTLRSIGTERFQLVWVGGMVIRLAVVAVAALVLAPAYRWQTGALLLALVGTLLVLLLVEAATAVREHSRDKR